MEEQRRRAEEALRLELRRQAIDRELARLRLLAGTALVGFIASIVILFIHQSGVPSRTISGASPFARADIGAAASGPAYAY